MPVLPLADAALRGALLATLLLLATALARAARRWTVARVGLALVAGLAVQTIGSLPAIERGVPLGWQAPLVAVSIGNAVLFWLFVRALFDDGFTLRPRHWAVWLGVAAIGAGLCVSMTGFGPAAPPTIALRFVLRWLPTVFALLVIAAAAAQWRADLVEPRRRLRAFIAVAGTVYALAMAIVRLSAPHGVPSPPVASLDTAAVLVICGGAAVALLRVGGAGELLPRATESPVPAPVPSPRAEAPDAVDVRLAAGLDRLMTVDRAYRVDDLTLGVLALKLGVPEYRLRRFIHQALGHRNFNAYVNGLRLAEVRGALADPARRGEGVLEIALAAGFASAGPFNRAFKGATGVTPTKFRRQALADC